MLVWTPLVLAFSLLVQGCHSWYTHSMFLDPKAPNDYEMRWSFDEQNITVELRVNNPNGWIAWGLSPNGNMYPSDVVLAYFNEKGEGVLEDRHTVAKSPSIMDKNQDYHKLSMTRADGMTIVKFTRKLILCDDDDRSITMGTQRVIWAYNDKTMDINTMHTRMGTHSVLLVDYADRKGSEDAIPQNKTISLRMTAQTLPRNRTMYMCKTFAVKDFVNLTSKHHLVRVSPFVQPGHEGFVHHILIYECRMNVSEEHLNKQHSCFARNMPDHVRGCRSSTIMHAWAIGGTTFNYPTIAGLSFGAEDDPDYFLVETHYDNPNKHEITDSSGLDLYLTPNLRELDAGVLTVGTLVGESIQIIPPKMPDYVYSGFCSADCLQHSELNNTKPKVFAGFLHAHLAGRKIITRLVNKNGTEVKRILQDLTYDFNFQEVKVLPQLIEIPPEHSIHVECHYDTTENDKPILGGEASNEEMCLAFLWHYPIIKPGWCASMSTYQYGEFQHRELGWNINNQGKINQTLQLDGRDWNGEDAWKALGHTSDPWRKNPNLGKKMQTYANLSPYIPSCNMSWDNIVTPQLNSKLPLTACDATNPTTAPPTSASAIIHPLQALIVMVLTVALLNGFEL